MAVETLLSFNGAGAFDEFNKRMQQVINDLCQAVMDNARANVGGAFPEVEASLHAGLSALVQQGMIDGEIGADAWQSFMAEWGSGSLMDRLNPGLVDYMNSELWNPLREANGDAITGRAKGPYIGLDGMVHNAHTGILAGRNLEQLRDFPWFRDWMAKVRLPDDAFTPKVPLHFMRDALESNRNLIMDQLNAVIETFSFGDFLV
ncbi:hypothetical protein [Alicyclobacillus dauci]|uniref:Uncharacterized protein n=1 Tax=Alicyclobacillus dauci TaxID=1475485 RepID=A0ABY6YY60_9BACL|nr:hypothetical protein [Alicyclobacillus dauci]WAH35046.1 hypothetical protein NZD86_11975 [Alicyclobacillus dauci]